MPTESGATDFGTRRRRKTACGPPQERQGTARNENFLKMRTEEALCSHLLTISASHSKLNLHYFCVCARDFQEYYIATYFAEAYLVRVGGFSVIVLCDLLAVLWRSCGC